MSDDDRWEKAEQLDVLHDKLEKLREENAALRARLEEVERERDEAVRTAEHYSVALNDCNGLLKAAEKTSLNEDGMVTEQIKDNLAALTKAREKGDLR